MDTLDRRLLNILQSDFPISHRPYRDVADRLGVSETEVLGRLRDLSESGVIRRVGPVFDTRRLGHVSLLVAAAVPPERLDEVARIVSAFPQVTHNYGRDHELNLWFALVCRDPAEADKVMEEIKAATGVALFHILPAEQMFKIRVKFDL